MDSILFFILDILKVPSVLVGLIAFAGLVAQKKAFPDIIKGTIKTILGFLVLSGGATVLLSSLTPLGGMFEHAFNVQGIIPNNEAIVSMAIEKYGTATALIMAFGMVANIIVARFTRLKFIFLTGHHTFYMACMIGVILTVAGFEGVQLVFVGSLTLGLIMAFFPAIAHRYMRKITDSNDVGFGHFGTLGYVLSGAIGQAVGKGSKSTEEMDLPKNLSFLRDSSISISLTMMVIYYVLAIASGSEYVSTLSGGQHYLVYATIQAITFAAGVYVILQGVRLILAEIVPAFTGFSEKLVPDAKPALDCPIVFPYAPNAVLIGFLASFAGGVISLAVLGQLNWVLILPGVVPHFFCGATAGVFGNATGGRRGAIIGAFAHGVLITFLPVFLLPVLGSLGFANTTFSDADFGGVGIVLGYMAQVFNKDVITAIIVGLFALLVAYNYLAKKPAVETE
ncbi:PTS system ascorbate-specific transporter subunit IIC [Actinobacillus pleuropneumoniae]|uniref:Ascorbate-specific PTS system EIIC component n=3 Tax=Actinobacillus TaxID=713 RepID=A0A380U2Q0_ACTLI|nr:MULTISPECIES: PTS ascorbate transporter subunit IIC [Actinobacillus]ASU15562.1 Ascorbate-specific PTS system EIIC component [Actinobacillus pleuropneumoniae]AWG96130.1 PTS ascorbate transporter subunit IIC [Actinobacillus pleuropneumoniae serovar 1 str. 4074]AXA22200.1 PTS ascorbate transporter subunit IIC [Actinobacillus pleuropneumoniae]EFL81173.1 ascorbate-specific PTS system enzyme IIC [Actinobacillus pleuropneumoniae serovar 6 str. Femo]EFM89080.1 sugar-specific permease SgaT/UlaA [Act